MIYMKVNVNQIGVIFAIFEKNIDLALKVRDSELEYFMIMVRENGFSTNFLQIFNILMTHSGIKEIQKKIIRVILNERTIEFINV